MNAASDIRSQATTLTRDLGGPWQPDDADRNLALALVLARDDNGGRLTAPVITHILLSASWGLKPIGAMYQLLACTADVLDDPGQRDSETGREALAEVNRLLDTVAALPPDGI
ncbi:hypothetical protein OEIGOIKO_07734 [Streptomyces chrestomyceticus JCM 4735]|uniref:Uncharacterized protein n=1 Tax=Streptomyces chrestomyceticus JCM 4735 TaxID=1306181 RepID=A0A7U9Q0U6_9ACTN|nr:hypothetical protein [Streptomyces chrestomyceticus]GCD39877.1 hypothetical protein OEIGOIKO_07734 [Streptomyces chrestomyceticus JCM 4735]